MDAEVLELAIVDSLGTRPTKTFRLSCADPVPQQPVIRQLNGKKWRGDIGIEVLRRGARRLGGCELVLYRELEAGGYRGGPLGRRTYVYPSIYTEGDEERSPEPDLHITCRQEGSHLRCAEGKLEGPRLLPDLG
jgi:hypothetical protein